MADYVVTLTGKDNLSGTIKSVKQELNGVGGSAKQLDKISAQFDKITKSSMPLNRQVRETSKLLSEMKFDGDYNAAQFLKMAKEAGEAKDAIGDTQQIIKAFADDNFALNTVVQGVQGIAAAGSVATGTMALFGVESESAAVAIQKVQGALAILNGLQTIANVLNKDSYVSIARKVIGLNLEAAATDKATAAQIRNNIAVLANPYVAAAAAVAALVAGLVYWASTMEDTTEEQETLNAAVDAFNEASEQQSNKLGEQLAVFGQLKQIYDESGGKVDVLTDKILNNKEAQRKLGVTLKTVDDVHRLFGQNSENYKQAAISRANALAAEAAEAAMLGVALSELSKIYAKLMKGEEVDWTDMLKAMEKAGISRGKGEEIIYGSGGDRGWDWFYSNLVVDPDKIADFVRNINSAVTDEFYKTGAGKALSELYLKNLSDADLASIDFNDLLTQNDSDRTKSTKGGKGGKGNKNAIDYEKGSLADLIAQREKLNEELKKKKLTDEQIKQKQVEIEALDIDIAAQEARINAYIKEQLELRAKLRNAVKGIADSAGYNPIKAIAEQAEQRTTAPSINAAKHIYSYLGPALDKLKSNFAERQAKDAEKVRQNWENAASALGSFGDAMSTLGQVAKDEGLQVAGIVAQAIAQVALGYAQATAQAGKLGPWGWAAFAAAGLAQMMAMISQIKSVTGGYASGGIIGGTSYSGDKLLARVNSGEMVLNKRQQTNLFNAINSGNIGGGTVSTVEFKLRGADIYGSMKNYKAIKSKTGLKGL